MKWLLLILVMLIAGCPVQPTPGPSPAPMPLPVPCDDTFDEEFRVWFADHFFNCPNCNGLGVCQEVEDKYNELREKHNR